MTYASDRLYNEVIRKKLAVFATKVKVQEILPHLSCLTISDRDEIEAKKETAGNYTAIQTLLNNLRRRENWPEEFISALRNCEHTNLADEISAAYDRIRGITNNTVTAAPSHGPPQAPAYSSAAATATVTKATVHAVPETTPTLLIPPLVEPPAHSAPSNTAAQVPSPTAVPQVPKAESVKQVEVPNPAPAPSSEPASQAEITPPIVAPVLATSPTVVSPSKVTSAVKQTEVPTHSVATKNTTSTLDTTDGPVLPEQTAPSKTDGTFQLTPQASSPNTPQSQITNPSSTSQSSVKSEKIQAPIAVQETTKSERYPVQDTNPLLKVESLLQGPEENSDPTANELVQRASTVGLPVSRAQTSSATPVQVTCPAPTEIDAQCPSPIDQEYFSKPGILQHPVPHEVRAEVVPVNQEEPCSVVSADLEISRTIQHSTEPEQSTNLAECPNNSHNPTAEMTGNDAPQNEAPLSPNQPAEDHYESCQSLQTGTLIHEFQIAEEPPAENFNGLLPSMLGNTFNRGEVPASLNHSTVNSEDQPTLNHESAENVGNLREPSGHDAEALGHKKSANINYQKLESNATRPTSSLQPEQREERHAELFQMNRIHLIAGAGIGLSAIFLAWKLRH